MKNCAIILAPGGDNSSALCEVLFRPALFWVIRSAKLSGIETENIRILGSGEKLNLLCSEMGVQLIETSETGAADAAAGFAACFERLLVLSGSAPLVSCELLKEAFDFHSVTDAAGTVVSASSENPFGFYRVSRDWQQRVLTLSQKGDGMGFSGPSEVSAGTFVFEVKAILDMMKTGSVFGWNFHFEIFRQLAEADQPVSGFMWSDSAILLSSEDNYSLSALCTEAKKMNAREHILRGVRILDENNVYIAPGVQIGEGTMILPGTIIKGDTIIGKNCVIGPNSLIDSGTIGDKCVLNASQLYSSEMRERANVGPFSHVRPGCVLEEGVHVGDFVELKNSNLGQGTSVSHLTYVGDSDVGKFVNFGCGVVTVNYSGESKNRTTVGDFAFIGCNTNLVAPVKIGNKAYTAAGSTVTNDVPDGALTIARARQINKEGRAEEMLKKYVEKKIKK